MSEYSDPQTLERLVRIETKMDFVVDSYKSQEARITALEKSIPDADHEARIRKLERVIWIAVGITSAVSGTASSVITQALGGG